MIYLIIKRSSIGKWSLSSIHGTLTSMFTSFKYYDLPVSRNRLELRKVQVRWVPLSLTFKQKEDRFKMCERNPEIYERVDPRRLFEIVAGDVTWIPLSPPIRKQDGKVWLKEGEVPPALCVSDIRAAKFLY
ncbi:hypothetical protein LOD99_4823 [Oopsacas minuta]|uniref:Uncharacterized protein n=1 Tax=Oopsacas minuta TaxID=111878 RepID=A0AAV7JSU1_9METZ|nr:hypothetical protein LOD99_4823 [Oopsacas minuta]